MSRLERIKAREAATEERSGRQDESWESERESRILDQLRVEYNVSRTPLFRRDEEFGFYY